MKNMKVDVAIIGAGTAGLGARRSALKHTNSIVMIEGGSHGTTCARVGCMPSKLLIASAEAAHALEKSSHLGLHHEGYSVNGREVMDRVKRERDRFVGFVLESVDEIPEEQKLTGYARFLDDHRLQVGDHTIVEASRIVLATGSAPVILPQFRELGDKLLINDDLFSMDDLPQSIAVFGPGVIGLELGQSLHRLGVKTFVFGRGGRVGPLTDPALIDYSVKTFQDEFYLNPDAHVKSMELKDNGVDITFVDFDGQDRLEHVDYVLAAIGRNPNLTKLGLENTSLKLDEKGMPAFDPFTMQIEDSHIFIAGDVGNFRPLLHEAADEGRIAGENAGRFPDIRAHNRRSAMGVVFSDPQMAMVGDTHASLPEGSFATGVVSFENQGRSRVMLKNKGLLHVYAEHGSGRFLGAEMLGPGAEHLAHLLAWAHQQKLNVNEMLEMPFYHPVIEEGLRTALRDVRSKLHLGPAPIAGCLDCGPGA